MTTSRRPHASVPSDDDDDDAACPICYRPARDISCTAATACGHAYCAGCLKDWLATKPRAAHTCPMCRAPIRTYCVASTATGMTWRVPPPPVAALVPAAALPPVDYQAAFARLQRRLAWYGETRPWERPAADRVPPVLARRVASLHDALSASSGAPQAEASDTVGGGQ